MSLAFRRTAAIKVASRNFSASAESPSVTIARNVLFMQAVNSAASVEELSKITLPAYDATKLSALNAASMAGTVKFVPDATAWQNMGTMDMLATDLSRNEVWPFCVGGLLLLGAVVLFTNSLPESAKKDSRYMQMLEGKHVYVPKKDRKEGEHGHGHGHAEAHAH